MHLLHSVIVFYPALFAMPKTPRPAATKARDVAGKYPSVQNYSRGHSDEQVMREISQL